MIDLWEKHTRQMDLASLKESADCPVCKHQNYQWLDGRAGSQTAVLCGRNSVQIRPSSSTQIDLEKMAEKLKSAGEVRLNPFMLKLFVENFEISIFQDGRAIVTGTDEVAKAKSVLAQFVGL